MTKRIHGAGGSSGGGGNQTTVVQPPAPVFTPDDAGLRSSSFAQLQFLLCEGEILGPVGGNTVEGLERSVYLDDTPVRVGDLVSPQPSDLVFSYGRPASQQTGVPDFTRISTVVAVDKQVKLNLPISQSITSPDPSSSAVYARVILTFEGLVDARSNGDVLPGIVGLGVQYQDAAGTFYTVFSGEVSGKFSGAFQREYDFLLQGVGPWRIVVTRGSSDDAQRSGAENTYRSSFSFSSVVLSLDQRLSYPYSSILSLGIRADQYSALPSVAIEVFGRILQVPSNYDPVTRTYTGVWDGTFKLAYSNNPAWVMYDIINNERFGLGEFVEPWQTDKWSLYAVAVYCDGMVPAAGGVGLEPRFTCNLILQTAEQAWTVLQQLSSIFRGLLYYAGGYIMAIQDSPRPAVFTFNESNTIEQFDEGGNVSAGNFTYSGAAKRSRSTVVLVSWDDPLDNYQPRVEYVANEIALARFGYKPKDLRLIGVTSRGQALRAAQATLLIEELLDDIVSFSTNEIGAAVRPGDRVKIADPNKAARRYGGRIAAVDGTLITLDASPTVPAGGWIGSTFSFMDFDSEEQPVLIAGSICCVIDNVVEVDGLSKQPAPGIPWLIETPDRTAQDFRILTVEEQDNGVYAFTALRYRADLFDAVDYGTALNDNESYLYKIVNPAPPTITQARVIWDNGQAKIDVEWRPPATSETLNGFDVSVREYRLQYQAGSLQNDGSIIYDGTWREVARQFDNREQISINQFVAADRFQVRVSAVGRLGAQSPWATADVEDIQVGSPMPDLGGTFLGPGEFPSLLPNATLSHINLSSGAHLFTWNIQVPVPSYVSGIQISARPLNYSLTGSESAGLMPMDDGDWMLVSTSSLDNYATITFAAPASWEIRANLVTVIPGITGTTYVFDRVDRLEIEPPPPISFAVVTEPRRPSTPLTRRFSWSITDQPPFITKWPDGVVTDIAAFDVRFKKGDAFSVNGVSAWDLGFPLFSDGISGDQRWFETNLFDSGIWTVMIRSRDKTGWQSSEFAFVQVNLGDALPTNVVERLDLKDLGFAGQLENAYVDFEADPSFYVRPLEEALYIEAQDDEFYEGIMSDVIVQTDTALPSSYNYPLSIDYSSAGLVVYVQSSGTYQLFLRKLGNSASTLMYQSPTTEQFYQEPVTSYIYRELANSASSEFHPLAPFERVDTGDYELLVRFASEDGVTPAKIRDIDIVIDYPDINEIINDLLVPVGGTRVTLKQEFRVLKAVNLTLQDSPGPGIPASAILTGKDRRGFNVVCRDINGNEVEALIDAACAGY